MADEQPARSSRVCLRVEASDPELADWMLSFSAGATPEEVVKLPRSALLSVE